MLFATPQQRGGFEAFTKFVRKYASLALKHFISYQKLIRLLLLRFHNMGEFREPAELSAPVAQSVSAPYL